MSEKTAAEALPTTLTASDRRLNFGAGRLAEKVYSIRYTMNAASVYKPSM